MIFFPIIVRQAISSFFSSSTSSRAAFFTFASLSALTISSLAFLASARLAFRLPNRLAPPWSFLPLFLLLLLLVLLIATFLSSCLISRLNFTPHLLKEGKIESFHQMGVVHVSTKVLGLVDHLPPPFSCIVALPCIGRHCPVSSSILDTRGQLRSAIATLLGSIPIFFSQLSHLVIFIFLQLCIVGFLLPPFVSLALVPRSRCRWDFASAHRPPTRSLSSAAMSRRLRRGGARVAGSGHKFAEVCICQPRSGRLHLTGGQKI